MLFFIAYITSGLDLYSIMWNSKVVFIMPTIDIKAYGSCLGGRGTNQ